MYTYFFKGQANYLRMDETAIRINKVNTRLIINSMLLGAVVSMFFLVASLQKDILAENHLLALQMVLAVPFFVTACIASAYNGEKSNEGAWYNFGWLTFIIAYAFTLNSIGIIISSITSILIGIIFFATSITLTLIYTLFLVVLENRKLKERLLKDFVFIAIQVLFGVIVILF